MGRSITGGRRIAGLFAGTAAAALLATGCSAGQNAATSTTVAAVPGVSATQEITENGQSAGSVAVRNVTVAYPGLGGYPAGGNAPLNMWIFNDTQGPITVAVDSPAAGNVALIGPGTATVGPATPVPPAPTASAPAGSAPAGAAQVRIPLGGYIALTPDRGQYIQLVGLREALTAKSDVELTFTVNGTTRFSIHTTLDTPSSPVPGLSGTPAAQG